jgi:DNA transformation protein
MAPLYRIAVRDVSLRDFLLDQLSPLAGVSARGMFGGHGFYLEGEFFGMVYKGRIYFRTDEALRAEARSLGSDPIPFGDDPAGNVYWEVPADVLEDAASLARWARTAAASPRPAEQRKARKGKPAPRRARGAK